MNVDGMCKEWGRIVRQEWQLCTNRKPVCAGERRMIGVTKERSPGRLAAPRGPLHLLTQEGSYPIMVANTERAQQPDERPTSLYKYFDRNSLLIYVGITNQGIGRNRQHNADKEWWRFVVRQEVAHFRTRAQALAKEKELIQLHRPPFNTQHNPDAADLRAVYLALVDDGEYNDTWSNPRHNGRRTINLPIHFMGVLESHALFQTDPADYPIAKRLDPKVLKALRVGGRRSFIQKVQEHERTLILFVSAARFGHMKVGNIHVLRRPPSAAPGPGVVPTGIEMRKAPEPPAVHDHTAPHA